MFSAQRQSCSEQAELLIFQDVDETVTGAVAPLVAGDDRFRIKGNTMVLYQNIDGFQDKVCFQGIAHHIGKDHTAAVGLSTARG